MVQETQHYPQQTNFFSVNVSLTCGIIYRTTLSVLTVSMLLSGVLNVQTLICFLRATAVPAGTAEARISYGNYVCLSVRLSVCPSVRLSRPGGIPSPGKIETPGLHHMIA